MALTQDQVGLLFRIDADAKAAKKELDQFKEAIEKLGLEFDESVAKKALAAGRKTEDGLGKSAKNTSKIVRETFETLSSEIIENFGIDGDIANAIANQLVVVRNASFIIGAAITATVAALGVGLVLAANKAAELGEQIGDLQKITGLTAETLSGLNVAAREDGKSLEALSGSLVAFNKNLIDAQRGSKDLQSIFKQLGVDFRGSTDAALRQAIKRLSEMESGAKKTAIAQRIFGDSVIDVIDVLVGLEGGIDKAIIKAKQLGLFFDDQAVKQAIAYKDQLREIGVRFEGIATVIGQNLIPVFNVFLGQLDASIKKSFDFTENMTILGGRLRDVFPLIAAGVGSAILGLGTEITPPVPKGKKPDIKLPGIKQGTKEDEASVNALRRLEIQLRDEEQLFKSNQEAIKRSFDQREFDEFDFADKQITAARDRLVKQKAIFDQEQKVIEGSKFSAERKKTELQQVNAKRIDLERDTADAIEKINDDLRKNLERIGIEREQAQLQVAQASLRRRAEAIRGALDQQAITNEEAEKEFTEITKRGIEARLALANAELDRAGQHTQLKEVALEKIKALEIELAAATEEGARRTEEARRRDIESLIELREQIRRQREEQLQGLGFNDAAASAIASLELLLGRTLTFAEAFRATLKALIQDAKDTLPTLGEVFLQTKDAVVNSLGVMIAAFVSGQSSIRQAVAAFYRAALQPLVDFLLKKARIQFALGIADLADLNFAGAAKHFLAGAALSAAAGFIGAGGTAIAGGGTTTPSSSFGGGGASQQSDRRVIEQGDRQRPEPQVIILRAEYQPGIIIQEMTRDYRNNGPSRQVLRRDILGEQPT